MVSAVSLFWNRVFRKAGAFNSSWRVSHYAARRFYSAAGWSRDLMEVHPAVAGAVATGRPVVALETTIVTHGMPYPHNLDTAREVESIVCGHGAVPATIGVLDGKIHIGLTSSQLERLATANQKGEHCVKVSRRDLAFVLSQGWCGGTTVSGTMLCAYKAGIPIFVTGGIGGVHRHGEHTMDVSADLTELSRSPVAVVCAGVKSILDIGRTLEVLETQGVTVATYADGDDFPAFFSRSSGHKSPCSIQSAVEGAKLIDSNLSLGLRSGVLIAVPIPQAFGNLGNEIEQATQQALSDAENAGITGKAVTPFVLQRINELTAGKSLEANIALVKNNAKVGSEIAVELAKLRRGQRSSKSERGQRSRQQFKIRKSTQKMPVVIGASNVDLTAKITSKYIKNEGTNPGSLVQSFGGVGRNIAECMARLGAPPLFISAVGQDTYGTMIKSHLEECGMETRAVLECGNVPSSTYCVVLDHNGEMYCAIGDMEISDYITYDWVNQFSKELSAAPVVCMDGNIPTSTIQCVTDFCHSAGIPVWYEPTCLEKAIKPFKAGVHSKLSYVSPNLSELKTMHSASFGGILTPPNHDSTSLTEAEKISLCMEMCKQLLRDVPNIVVSLGSDGLLYARRTQQLNTKTGSAVDNQEMEGNMIFQHYPAAAEHLLPVAVTSVTGAGDSFVGGMLAALTSDLSLEEAVKVGMRAAYLSLHSKDAISTELNADFLVKDNIRVWSPWKPTTLL